MKNKVFGFAATVLVLVASIGAAQGQLPTCIVSTDNVMNYSCSGTGWYTGLTQCAHRTVTCTLNNNPITTPLGITYGYTNPSNSNGTIVFFSYAGGTSPSDTSYNEATYAAYYDSKGFQVVQTMWDNGSGTDSNSDWEDTGFSGAGAKQVGYAAGRPAAFLNFVRFGSPTGGPPLWTAKGMCAQGNSAGGGAIAYILAWYGGYSYIDHAVFLSSPPLSDFKQGCSVTPQQPVPVTVCPTGQLGCSGTASWQAWPQYTDARTGVRQWTDDSSQGTAGVCRGSATSSTTANTEWKNMSIVDGNVNTFNYQQTSMTAWLCNSVQNDGDSDDAMNNSSSQAQLYFGNFTSSSQIPLGLTIHGVSNCNGPEDVTNANPPQLSVIEDDMTTQCVKNH